MFTIPRYLLCVLFALFAVLPALADVEYGLLQGTVKYDDGLLCGRATLTAKAANRTFPFMTEPDGTFSGIVPVGNVTFTVNGTSTRAQILPGQVNKVVLTATRPGWIVKIVSPDGAPADMAWVNAAYKAPAAPVKKGKRPANGNRGGIGGMRLTTGRYWFPLIPANATAFAIIAAQGQGNATTHYRTQWQFTTPSSKRTLSMTVKRSAQLWLIITEETDKPLTGVSVHGSLTSQVSVRPKDYWSTIVLPTQAARQNITGGKTDERGAINLGRWPVGKYDVMLVAGDHAGRPLAIEIKPDGTVTQKTYRASLRPRTVTQTVFTASGTPAANATVSASYYWGGAACLRSAQADAQGQVTWTDLPPVRTITWGEKVRPSVIPCEGDTFTTPLPAPTVQGWATLCFKVTNPLGGNARTTASIYGERVRDGMSNFNYDDLQARREELTEWTTRVICGTPFTLRWLSLSSTTQCCYLSGIYAPYVDTDQPVDYPLELQEGAEIHGKFVDQRGTAIPGVSRLQVKLLKPANAAFSPEMFTASPDDEYNGDWLTRQLSALQTPKVLADGSFTMQTLVPGTYRVLVDLYDTSSPTPPGCVLDVKPGKNDLTITLPDPLFTVPAGTNVKWLTRTAPAVPQELLVAAHAPSMPVYGPQESLLACWYQTSPNKLEVWDRADGRERKRTLSLRTSYLTIPGVTDDAQMPQNFSCKVYPMLPALSRQEQQYAEVYDGRIRRSLPPITSTESKAIILRAPFTAQRYDLWTGAYVLETGKGLARFDVTETGDPQVLLPVGRDDMQNLDENGGGEPTKAVRLSLPRIDYNAVRQKAAHAGMVMTDVPFRSGENVSNELWGNQEEWVTVPSKATSITVQWLGMGVARDLKIPNVVDQQTPLITVREWSPGLYVSGTIVRADGKPFAKGQLTVILSGRNDNSSHSMRLKTDANGKFSIKGLLPGPLFIWNESSSAGWSLNVPEDSLERVVLKMSSEPIRIALYDYPYSGQAVAWWLPDGGKPYLLPKRWSECGGYDVPTGSGWLWIIDNTTGRSSCTRQLLVKGRNHVVPRQAEGPSLGIIFPLDARMELPGMVTIIGQGEREGLKVSIPNFGWAPSALLQLVTGQIDAVPPGTYMLQVATPHGTVESLVTVTENGSNVKLTMPPATEDTALADVAAR